ncbi:hypothetical protein GCM10018781_60200 [Kitasatospora indigofera]|uniref:DUF4139 domain-containing protein n=1 Tax=Kitasatospora indigofera TaxID=67307 RepID=A0A919GAE0_9ACTN|nr:hypothetical protein GCM10018781_60200 [Kitasatospora indigofera]
MAAEAVGSAGGNGSTDGNGGAGGNGTADGGGDGRAATDGGAAAAGSWESVLDSVVVYAVGAVCRRRARGPVPAGRRVRLTGLPQVLDGRSLRASVVGGAPGWSVIEARLEPRAELRERSELPELRRRLDEARERESAVRERHGLVRARIDETAALRAVPPPRRREEPHRRTPADAWLELADFVDERLTGLHARAEELVEELRLAEHETEVLTDLVDRSSTAGPSRPVETGATVLLTLSGPPAAPGGTGAGPAADGPGPELEIELEYGVPGARWVPAYRLDYRQGAGSGSLLLRASVVQRTGEDWAGVRLALSSADLERRTELPRLRSLRIGRSQPAPPPTGWREPPSGLSELFAGYDAAGPRPAGERPVPVAAARPVASRPRGGSLEAGGPPVPPPAPFAPALAPSAAPPPAPGGYGAPPPPPVGYGAPQAAAGFGGAAPAPQPAARARRGGTRSADIALAAPGGPPPGAPQAGGPAGPPAPDRALLDYPALRLSGPEQGSGHRGELRPATDGPAGRPDPAARGRAERVAALPLPRHAVPPRRSAGSFDHRFDAAAPADIPSDGTWHTVTVGEVEVGLRPEYICVPSVEERVYGTLVITNDSAQALLAGPVEVTVDGDHLLTAGLPSLARGGTRRLGLGVTESIEVARRTELRESTAGMLNSSTVLDHRVHVELANRLGHPVTVEVRERVPVPSEADIRIEERAGWQAPQDAADDLPASSRLWRVEVPAGGRAELDGGYEIRIPAGKAIVGGNRRN